MRATVGWRYALWWLLAGSSVVFFVASAASFGALWKFGVVFVAINFLIEEIGQGLGYWKTGFDLHIHRFPLSLGVTYFFAGMLFVQFLPHSRPAQWIHVGSIAFLTTLVEQVLIRAGIIQWGPKMRYRICLFLHALSLGALYVAALVLGRP